MSSWSVNVAGKGIRRASVDKLAKSLREEFGDDALIVIHDSSPPESRADRLQFALDKVADARAEIEVLKEELEEWLENLPENFADGEKGDALREAIDGLDSMVSDLESIEGNSVDFPSAF